MKIYFAKSLDRPMEVFGVKGKWLSIFLSLAGVSVFVAIVAGATVSTGVGIAAAILLVVCSFIGCLVAQGSISHRELKKLAAEKKIYPYVNRTETICRILLPDPRQKK